MTRAMALAAVVLADVATAAAFVAFGGWFALPLLAAVGLSAVAAASLDRSVTR